VFGGTDILGLNACSLAVSDYIMCAMNVKIKDAFGRQIESYKDNTSHTVFGTGTRDQRDKVYQDAESEKTYFGRLSPGPCAYDFKVLGPFLTFKINSEIYAEWEWQASRFAHAY
jgi:hypothetical protein